MPVSRCVCVLSNQMKVFDLLRYFAFTKMSDLNKIQKRFVVQMEKKKKSITRSEVEMYKNLWLKKLDNLNLLFLDQVQSPEVGHKQSCIAWSVLSGLILHWVIVK